MTMNCKSCGKDKPVEEMYVRNGKPIRTCLVCRQDHIRAIGAARAKTMQSIKISRAVKVQSAALPSPAIDYPVLELLPGWGVNAAIEEGRLVLRQDGEARTDEISLSRSEARTLFAHFSTWAA
jgi:hypothetical protein